ncbi:unnamed protein product [Bemisia tabaci]|uniref:HECT domain-containing protein n=1 Tax=Bemisia tabaci TaxID=7038 RepID=A0A9P0A920_BEMTA|nr:unnamed protein product [Bemisia tabaci]
MISEVLAENVLQTREVEITHEWWEPVEVTTYIAFPCYVAQIVRVESLQHIYYQFLSNFQIFFTAGKLKSHTSGGNLWKLPHILHFLVISHKLFRMDSHEGRYMRRVKELLDEYEATQPRRSNQNLQAEPTTTQNLPPNRTAPPHNEQHPTTSQNSQPNIIAPPRIFPNVSTSQNMALRQTLAQRIENVTSKKFSPYSISKAQFRARPKTPSRRSVSVEFKIPKVILLPVKSHFLSLNKKQNSFIASHKLFRDNLMLLRTDSESEVKQKLRQRFEPLLNNKDFIIVKSEGDVLVEPILDVQQCLDGNNVAEIFLRQQKKMYVIPSVDLDPRYTGSDCPFLTHLCQRKVDEFMERDEQEEESENDQSAFEFMEILDPKDQSEDDQVTPKYLEKHDQREDHGDHSYAAAIQESLEISKEGIMQTLKNQLVKEDQSKLIVDRGHPFESAIIWFQLPGFDHRKNIYVQFTNTFGGKQEGVKPLTEGGIDLGGPTLEFFQLSIDDACHSSLFEGPEEARFLTLDADAVCENKFYHCGLLFALSITHGGPGPNCFAPEFVSCLEKQSLSDRLLSENAVFDVDLRSQIETLKNINAIDSLRDFVVNNGIVGLAGINTVINSLDEKDRVTEASDKQRLNSAYREHNEEMLREIPTLSSVLAFTTGLKREPPFGWKLQPEIKFQHSTNNDESTRYLLPKANTCSAVLELPVIHKSFDTFKKFMNKGLTWGTTIELA